MNCFCVTAKSRIVSRYFAVFYKPSVSKTFTAVRGILVFSQTTRGEACGLIGVNAGNLTGGDSRMKARLRVLPDKLRGGAWPSPVRAVRCPVKSGNDRDPRPLLLLVLRQAH